MTGQNKHNQIHPAPGPFNFIYTKTVYLLAVVVYWSALGTPLQAASIRATVRLDTTDGTLGDIFHGSWQVRHPAHSVVQFPVLDKHVATFDILDQSTPRDQNGQTLQNLVVAVYDSVGPHDFPSQTGLVISGNDTVKFTLPGFRVLIHSVLTAGDSTFRPIKPIHQVRLPFNWFILLYVVLGIAAIYLIYRFWPKRKHRIKQKRSKFIYIPPEQAHIIALRELKVLGESDYPERGEFKQFYSDLTTILRRYFERRFLINALEMTTTEVLSSLRAGVLSELEVLKIQSILEQGDLVKFAKHLPGAREARWVLELAVEIVQATKVELDVIQAKTAVQPKIEVEDQS